jgi:hypothetical protein
MKIATIGIDLGKSTFHLVGFDEEGRIVARKRCSRLPPISSVINSASRGTPSASCRRNTSVPS